MLTTFSSIILEAGHSRTEPPYTPKGYREAVDGLFIKKGKQLIVRETTQIQCLKWSVMQIPNCDVICRLLTGCVTQKSSSLCISGPGSLELSKKNSCGFSCINTAFLQFNAYFVLCT